MSEAAVRHIMATVFAAQNALRALAPEYHWAGLGNLLGDYGEFICISQYDLEKAPPGTTGHDAVTRNGQTVQIKANHASKTIGFRGHADLLLVVKVSERGEIEELFYGPFELVLQNSNRSERDNKWTITIAKLVRLRDSFP